jgi:hypothetical protein
MASTVAATRALVTPTILGSLKQQRLLGGEALQVVPSLLSVSSRRASSLVVRAGSGLPSPTKVIIKCSCSYIQYSILILVSGRGNAASLLSLVVVQ